MTALNINQILAAEDMALAKVQVPEWGDQAYVCVLPMTGSQLDLFEASKDKPNIRGKMLGWCLCDEDGKRLNPTPEQVTHLGNKSGIALTRVTDKILEISSLGIGAIEEQEKN